MLFHNNSFDQGGVKSEIVETYEGNFAGLFLSFVTTLYILRRQYMKLSLKPENKCSSEKKIAEVSWSNGVPFFPPSDKYWRIGGKWYDLSDFLDKHPGGASILMTARDRFEDCTFVFESHHHDFTRARAVIRKYEVPEKVALKNVHCRPIRDKNREYIHYDKILDTNRTPALLDNEAFYSVLRKRAAEYLRSIDNPQGLPTWECVILFWSIFACWACLGYATWFLGSYEIAFLWGISAAWLGAFGHNWVHHPRYKKWGWALLSLDTVGFSSNNWFRQHVLQHHMYTNSPWDNHFKGTDPFLKTDPTVERSYLQKHVTPYINPVLLSFGLYVNYIAHTRELINGNETFSIGKLFLPLQFLVMLTRWGFRGILLLYTAHAVLGMYYFTMALMNHNATHCMDVKTRNECKDWGIMQMQTSADWGVGLSFRQAIIYLWLNFHTVHHLFPKIDFSHHPAIQKILIQTCKDFTVDYHSSSPIQIYKQMIRSFATPLALMEEITVYARTI